MTSRPLCLRPDGVTAVRASRLLSSLLSPWLACVLLACGSSQEIRPRDPFWPIVSAAAPSLDQSNEPDTVEDLAGSDTGESASVDSSGDEDASSADGTASEDTDDSEEFYFEEDDGSFDDSFEGTAGAE